jgi:hypothetical protein
VETHLIQEFKRGELYENIEYKETDMGLSVVFFDKWLILNYFPKGYDIVGTWF